MNERPTNRDSRLTPLVRTVAGGVFILGAATLGVLGLGLLYTSRRRR